MRKSVTLLGGVILFVMVIGFARPAAAQDTPKAELSAGYSWLAAKSAADDEWTKFPKGWYVDVAGNVTPTFSLVGQFTGNYKTFEDDDFDLTVYSFMGGVRLGSPGRIKGFGQVLVGGARLTAKDEIFGDFSETDFAVQVGAGINVLASSNVGLRLGVDYQRFFATDDGDVLGGDNVNGVRVNVGIVIGF